MANPTIISLAVLKANWDLQGKDYLETFVPIVAQCIMVSPHEVVSAPDLQNELRKQFGLDFPQSAIKTVLSRVHKRGYVRLENKVYKRNMQKLMQLGFQDVQQQVVRKHEGLIQSLIKYCSDKFEVNGLPMKRKLLFRPTWRTTSF